MKLSFSNLQQKGCNGAQTVTTSRQFQPNTLEISIENYQNVKIPLMIFLENNLFNQYSMNEVALHTHTHYIHQKTKNSLEGNYKDSL